MSERHPAAESLVGKAGGEATFKPTSWARQRAWSDVRAAGCFKAKLKQANVASAPVHWTFGGAIQCLLTHIGSLYILFLGFYLLGRQYLIL